MSTLAPMVVRTQHRGLPRRPAAFASSNDIKVVLVWLVGVLHISRAAGEALVSGSTYANGSYAEESPELTHDVNFEFNEMYHTLIFIVALWFCGKLFARLGTPALVGEIVVGIVLGPHVVNLAAGPHFLMLFGELGLVLLMVEAGLHVDMEMLQVVGSRALAVGLVGSVLPMAMGFSIALFFFGSTWLEAFAIGATMATMSTGIALNVLKAGDVLNQPTGQLIIAAATVNEMVNIVLLTELNAITLHGGWRSYCQPLVIMCVLVVCIGFAAVKCVPKFVDKLVLPRVQQHQRENAVLTMIFVATLLFMPLCKYTGSSELLGAFLAGFCFCSDAHVHHSWHRQVKRVAAFLMRFFFACSIGFTIPIEDFADWGIIRDAGLLFVCIIGKVGMGFFATPFDQDHILTLGFAWGAWGEFSFILALKALRGNVITQKTYNSVVLAVLISVLTCPMVLRSTLARMAKRADLAIREATEDTADAEAGTLHSVYYCVQARSHARWGQQEALLTAIAAVGTTIIDFREFHPITDLGTQHVIDEIYLKDLHLKLKIQEALPIKDSRMLEERIRDIMEAIADALGEDDPEIKISRWLPGSTLGGSMDLLEHRGAHSEDAADVEAGSSERMDEAASQAAFKRLQESQARHRRSMARALDSTSSVSSPRPHHELDGYVHTEAHDAFGTTAAGEYQRGGTYNSGIRSSLSAVEEQGVLGSSLASGVREPRFACAGTNSERSDDSSE